MTVSLAERSFRADLPLPALALNLAQDFMGVREVGGENRGPAVEWLQRLGHTPPGSPWCAVFVYAVMAEACARKNAPDPMEGVKIPAYVNAVAAFGHAKGWERTFAEAAPGDLFLLWSVRESRYHHIGFVFDVDREEKMYSTIEGNSNTDGSAEGYEVASNPRHLASDTLFLNPWGDE